MAPTKLPACPEFIFTPPPKHPSKAASVADPNCKSLFLCKWHRIRLSCYCQEKGYQVKSKTLICLRKKEKH